MSEAVLFDVDGTLVDSVDAHAWAWVQVLEHFGHPVRYQSVRRRIGMGADQLVPSLLGPVEAQRWGPRLAEAKKRVYRERFLPRVRPFTHVLPLVRRLRQDGVRVGLVTSGDRDELMHHVDLIGLDGELDVLVSGDDAPRSKPQPDLYARAVEQLGGMPDWIVSIGDSPYDAIAARRAGLEPIGVLSGGFTARELRDAGVRDLYEDAADLLHRYESWRRHSRVLPPGRSAEPHPPTS